MRPINSDTIVFLFIYSGLFYKVVLLKIFSGGLIINDSSCFMNEFDGLGYVFICYNSLFYFCSGWCWRGNSYFGNTYDTFIISLII